MSDPENERFRAVDALITSHAVLPPPAERERLRKAHGLTQDKVATTIGVRRATLIRWEKGQSDPTPPEREVYAHLLAQLASHYPAPHGAPAPAPQPATTTTPTAVPEPAESKAPATAVSAPTHTGEEAVQTPKMTSRKPSKKTAAKKPTTAPASDSRFTHGPLAVLDGDGSAYCTGGLVLDCPATTIPQLVQWTLTEAKLGAPRLHRSGGDFDPLVALTTSAAERLGLPDELADRRGLRLPEDHTVVKQITKAKWQLTKRGFGPWARIYRPATEGQRQCVQLAVLPWGALDIRSWGDSDQLPPAELAQILGDYATRVLTPRGSTAVNGLELMTALRPPTRAVRDVATDTWVPGAMPGSLTSPVDPAPPEAPSEHPLAQGQEEFLDEEAYEWIRDPQLLTDTECGNEYAIGLDVNMAFAAAANRLIVGLGAPQHRTRPAFDKKQPGCWYVDLSHVELDPRLPNPFTPHGGRPTSPAWYATPTLAYALELGYDINPTEAYVRPESGPYLDPWYQRLREAYLTTMAQLGVTTDMDEQAFLTAMDQHKTVDPAQAAVLSAIKATVKGGIGKLRERPQGTKYRPGQRWPALERATWRPDIRAAVIATARVNMHRKIRKLADHAGLFPLAALSDCVVYPSPGPSPLDLLPYTAEGKPLPGGFRLGVSPGMSKVEGVQSFLWAAQMLDEGHNPARHIKDTDHDDGA